MVNYFFFVLIYTMDGTYLGQDTRRRVVGIARARRLGQGFTRERTETMIDNLNVILNNMDEELENETQVSQQDYFRIERNMVRTAIRNLNRHLFRLRGQGGMFSRPSNRIAPAPAPAPVEIETDVSSVDALPSYSEREDVEYEPESISRRTEEYVRDPDSELLNREIVRYGTVSFDPRHNSNVRVLGLERLSNPDLEEVGESLFTRRGTNRRLPYMLFERVTDTRDYPMRRERARRNQARRSLERQTTLPDELMDKIMDFL